MTLMEKVLESLAAQRTSKEYETENREEWDLDNVAEAYESFILEARRALQQRQPEARLLCCSCHPETCSGVNGNCEFCDKHRTEAIARSEGDKDA